MSRPGILDFGRKGSRSGIVSRYGEETGEDGNGTRQERTAGGHCNGDGAEIGLRLTGKGRGGVGKRFAVGRGRRWCERDTRGLRHLTWLYLNMMYRGLIAGTDRNHQSLCRPIFLYRLQKETKNR